MAKQVYGYEQAAQPAVAIFKWVNRLQTGSAARHRLQAVPKIGTEVMNSAKLAMRAGTCSGGGGTNQLRSGRSPSGQSQRGGVKNTGCGSTRPAQQALVRAANQEGAQRLAFSDSVRRHMKRLKSSGVRRFRITRRPCHSLKQYFFNKRVRAFDTVAFDRLAREEWPHDERRVGNQARLPDEFAERPPGFVSRLEQFPGEWQHRRQHVRHERHAMGIETNWPGASGENSSCFTLWILAANFQSGD